MRRCKQYLDTLLISIPSTSYDHVLHLDVQPRRTSARNMSSGWVLLLLRPSGSTPAFTHGYHKHHSVSAPDLRQHGDEFIHAMLLSQNTWKHQC